MTKWLTLLCSLWLTGSVLAQHDHPHVLQPAPTTGATEQCGTVEYNNYLQQQYPDEFGTTAEFEQWMSEKIEARKAAKAPTVVYTIPVVVHIIHNGDPLGSNENITDAQVLSQIEVLNEDFRRLPGTPGFNNNPVGADTEIEFCLATVDENGNATTGITRTNLGVGNYSMSQFNANAKPATQWDPTNYMNIWVGNLEGGLLGYAQFPSNSNLAGVPNFGGAANTDGVVIGYQYFGSILDDDGSFNLDNFYNQGRTATHEVGHFFGLRHIWGDGDCSVDDFCDDTPRAAQANGTCNTPINSCNDTNYGSATDPPDMTNNYMDYTVDNCMDIFTLDQKARMQTVMQNSPRRASLANSIACGGPQPPTAEFSVSSTSVCPGGTITFTDDSESNVTSRTWTFEGGVPATSTEANPTVLYTSPGIYDVTLSVTNDNGTDVIVQSNFITVGGSGGSAVFYSQDFENGLDDWGTANNNDNSFTWEAATVSGSATNGTGAAFIDNYDYNAPGELDFLVSPVLDFAGQTGVTLTFDHAYVPYGSNNSDSLIVAIYSQSGGNFEEVAFYSGGVAFSTAGNSETNAFSPDNADDWCHGSGGAGCVTIDLSAYDGMSNMVIAFVNINGWGNNTYIDNVALSSGCAAAGPQAPIANFISEVISEDCEEQVVKYTDASAYSPTSYSWSFPGGSPATSTASEVTVTYSTPGSYSASLTATNAEGSDTADKPNEVVVDEGIVADGVASTQLVDLSLGSSPVQFTDNSVGVVTRLWDFGDFGTTSTQSPSILYTQPGTYSVILTVDDGLCTDVQTIVIEVVETVSVANIAGLEQVRLYPNPTSGLFQLELSVSQATRLDVDIVNVLGQSVLREDLGQVNGQVVRPYDLSQLPSGMYFVRLSSGTRSATFKVVVE